jgi:hypothetical protein
VHTRLLTAFVCPRHRSLLQTTTKQKKCTSIHLTSLMSSEDPQSTSVPLALQQVQPWPPVVQQKHVSLLRCACPRPYLPQRCICECTPKATHTSCRKPYQLLQHKARWLASEPWVLVMAFPQQFVSCVLQFDQYKEQVLWAIQPLDGMTFTNTNIINRLCSLTHICYML